MSSPAGDDSGQRRAWGWVAALRTGDATPWQEWREPADRRGRYLPGAQQLELLRRLNLAGRPSDRLIERVLTASAPGRGRPDLELVGAGADTRFGPRPVEPADLPDAELIRVASGLLAEDLVAAGVPDRPAPGLPRPWRRHYRLVGDPWLADPLRDELTRRGRPPGGRRSVVLVLGTDLAGLLGHAWTARSFDEGGAPWADWLGAQARHDRVPPRADLVRFAETWTGRVGRSRVEVVLDPERLPRLVGVRRLAAGAPSYSPDAVDLARRITAPLGLLVLPDERARLLRHRYGGWVAGTGPADLRVPPHLHEWVQGAAVRMRDALLGAGYAVHGDPDQLVPDAPDVGTVPDDAGVLELSVRLLLERDREARTE